jgi:hypothetical protein
MEFSLTIEAQSKLRVGIMAEFLLSKNALLVLFWRCFHFNPYVL